MVFRSVDQCIAVNVKFLITMFQKSAGEFLSACRHVTCKKHNVYWMSEFCWWNLKYFIHNKSYNIIYILSGVPESTFTYKQYVLENHSTHIFYHCFILNRKWKKLGRLFFSDERRKAAHICSRTAHQCMVQKIMFRWCELFWMNERLKDCGCHDLYV